jgi:hypothetical protein
VYTWTGAGKRFAQSVGKILSALFAVQTMYVTGADFTNTFRWLADIPLPASSSARGDATQLNGSASRDVTKDQHNCSRNSTAGAWEVPMAFTYCLLPCIPCSHFNALQA